MWERLPSIFKWGFVVIALSPIWGALVWLAWAGTIRPRMIPRSDIDRMADDLIARYGDRAEEVASIEEDRAWRRSEPYEQGKWRRVRRALQYRHEDRRWSEADDNTDGRRR